MAFHAVNSEGIVSDREKDRWLCEVFVRNAEGKTWIKPAPLPRQAPPATPSQGKGNKAKSRVGNLIDTEWGKGVIIEEQPDALIVAVKGGIKKIKNYFW